MANLKELQLSAFQAQNRDVDVQKGRYLRRWKYKIHFYEDVPRTFIKGFAREIGAETEWTSDGHATVYFDDILIHKMARAIVDVDRIHFRQVMLEAEALEADAEWQERAQYRIHFERWKRPDAEQLALKIEDEDAELVTEQAYDRMAADGTFRRHHNVVAVLTNSDETMALLRLAYPGTHLEERRSPAR